MLLTLRFVRIRIPIRYPLFRVPVILSLLLIRCCSSLRLVADLPILIPTLRIARWSLIPFRFGDSGYLHCLFRYYPRSRYTPLHVYPFDSLRSTFARHHTAYRTTLCLPALGPHYDFYLYHPLPDSLICDLLHSTGDSRARFHHHYILPLFYLCAFTRCLTFRLRFPTFTLILPTLFWLRLFR